MKAFFAFLAFYCNHIKLNLPKKNGGGGGGLGEGQPPEKITAGHWPFSVHICQIANHFPKWSAAMANHILALMIMPLFP